MQRFITVAAAAAMVLSSGAVLAHDAGVPLQVATAEAGDVAHLPAVESLPAGVIQVSPFVPGMGEHWADPKNLPLGPIYCVMEGHVTCMEYMIAQDDFEAGKSFTELKPWYDGTEQPAVDHIEFNFEPNGHEGYEIPHYDVHMYFVSPETREAQTAAAARKQAAR